MAADAMKRNMFLESTRATAWSISNFKSIEHAEVSLAPGAITVLTGTNSVGKSSLLQSLLMLCQSLNSNGDDLVLNGSLTRLGIPEDVVRDGFDSCQMGIEYCDDDKEITARCKISLKPTIAKSSKSEFSSLTITTIDMSLSDGQRLMARSSGFSRNDAEECKTLLNRRRKIPLSNMTVLKVLSNKTLTKTYIVFCGIRAIAVVRLRNTADALKAFRERVSRSFSSSIELKSFLAHNFFYYEAFRREFFSPDGEFAPIGDDFSPSRELSIIYNRFKKLSPDERSELQERIALRLAIEDPHELYLIRRFSKFSVYDSDSEREAGSKRSTSRKSIAQLIVALGGLSDALSDIGMRVSYIGPLRDDPRVISPLMEETGNNIPIGIKGERSAAVLLSGRDRLGEFGIPDQSMQTFKQKSLTLAEAVNAWSQYLGVANSVHASNKQKLGVSISIDAGSSERDLTQVGVGASQAIPILVGVLC